jgi:Rps23 Pro-64 3,4-dihydroxylase Tpa1-like proline 4-hydroxylase
MFVNEIALSKASAGFKGQKPFDHCIIEDFFLPDVAAKLEEEFPNFDSKVWHEYQNAIEIKKTCNNWNVFPPLTYRVLAYLNSDEFSRKLGHLLGFSDLIGDAGLNGGGWHIHKQGGKLNTHLDYNIHPKLGWQRKLNIIVYLNSQWDPAWGGQLGLWAQSPEGRKPGDLVKSIDPVFNRAILFDTTQDSWHGLPTPLFCPDGQARKSLAIYYLIPAPADADVRGKALFAPTREQEADQDVLDLIKKRSDVASAGETYRAK